jgi:hypothetical protein
MLRSPTVGAVVLATVAVFPLAVAEPAPRPPNVVLVLCDALGYGDCPLRRNAGAGRARNGCRN